MAAESEAGPDAQEGEGIGTGDQGPMTVSSDPGLQSQAVDAFIDLVEALALQRPLVVGVDDL